MLGRMPASSRTGRHGEAMGIAATPLDADHALARSSDRQIYEQVFDNALVGICFMQGRQFLRVNARMEEMLGYGPGELTGLSVRTVYARQQDFDEVGRVVAQFPDENRYEHERPLITRDGRMLWCLISGRLIDPRAPSPTSVWVVQDLSAKKRAEEEVARARQRLEQTVQRRTLNQQKTNAALKQEVERRRETERALIESREKYRALIRNVPLGIVITDAAGDIVEANPAMLGFFHAGGLAVLARELAARSCTVLSDGTELSLSELIRRCSPAPGHEPAHLSIRHGSGASAQWFDVVGVRVPVSDLGSAVLFLDRSEQRRARAREHEQQQQLAHATRLSMMGQFASALAHELGQPLNACLSYAAGIEHRLGATLESRPDARDALQHIQLHLQQAGHVVRNVRAFVARHRPEDEAVDLPQLVRDTLSLLQLQLREAAVTTDVQLAEELPVLHGSRVELQQVLVNLVVNAIEATSGVVEAPMIRLQLAARGNGVRVRVEDNGPGIAPEQRARLFEPYQTTKPSGLGMGLMMCRTIIESHGGTLRHEAAPDGGACFVFDLPGLPVDTP